MSVFDLLKGSNEYPIVFIGSGISKRYVQEFPSWPELLESFWNQINQNDDFYAYLNTLRSEIKAANPNAPDNEIMYLTNIEAGTVIESSFNTAFFKGEITIENLNFKEAYNDRLSPFKKAISNKFSSYTLKEGNDEELTLFKKFLNKTQIILTTNYDNLIEDCFNSINTNGLKKYVGQSGFFEQTYGWAEIYKLHGSTEKPDSIVISKADYDRFSKNSILISAKIISLLIHSPIIFMGYSLTDMNIREIIKDFSSSMTPVEIKRMASRIIIVERDQGNQEINESQYYENELGCEYTVVRTDNYKEIYSKLVDINQGISPAEVRKYQHVLKKLIVDTGKKGTLNEFLVSPEDLGEIEKRIGDVNLVVALGDARYIFKMPDLMTYFYEYFFFENGLQTDIALRFIASQSGRVPFVRYTKGIDIDKASLNSNEKEKIKQRINNNKNVESCISSITGSNRIRTKSIQEILAAKYKQDKEYDIVAHNVLHVPQDDLLSYIKGKIIYTKELGIASPSTQFRRLLLAYDLAYNNIEVSAESPQ
ncbi:SIR2 family protein [Paenibacillus sp. FSL H8-0034]|uniref:SIR2 family protein n=1 Tax=Paenibacillus sp. FSL H8-0034 TaxID=2954671 RepID=UPI0030F7B15D